MEAALRSKSHVVSFAASTTPRMCGLPLAFYHLGSPTWAVMPPCDYSWRGAFSDSLRKQRGCAS